MKEYISKEKLNALREKYKPGVDSCRIINENADTPEQTKIRIENRKALQDAGKLMPCPRCGRLQMKLPSAHNAWSRYADVYVCDACYPS